MDLTIAVSLSRGKPPPGLWERACPANTGAARAIHRSACFAGQARSYRSPAMLYQNNQRYNRYATTTASTGRSTRYALGLARLNCLTWPLITLLKRLLQA